MNTEKTALYSTVLGLIAVCYTESGITGVHFMRNGIQPHTSEKSVLADTAIRQINEYLEGKRYTFDLPLQLEGTEFQKKVWNELLKIPYGETASYKAIAERICQPKAARAVGMANNKNKIAIIIPCHRVIGSTGALTGYAAGLDIKRTLLQLEARYSNFLA